MKIEALNCPNCGGAVFSDAAQCQFCRSRLKTMACPACLGVMFSGSQHCPRCGAKTVQPEIKSKENLGKCPRCQIRLSLLKIEEINLRECQKCDGVWADAEIFETVCARRESQAAVLGLMAKKSSALENKNPVRYIPCPDCSQLMNRSNFARSSGVVIDICKQHGVWFEAEELPRIIEFIRAGGLDHARQKEKLEIKEQIKRLREERHKANFEECGLNQQITPRNTGTTIAVREFVRFLFDARF